MATQSGSRALAFGTATAVSSPPPTPLARLTPLGIVPMANGAAEEAHELEAARSGLGARATRSGLLISSRRNAPLRKKQSQTAGCTGLHP
jgi:hypothetical protein